jgi:hypothetical protein
MDDNGLAQEVRRVRKSRKLHGFESEIGWVCHLHESASRKPCVQRPSSRVRVEENTCNTTHEDGTCEDP